MQDGVGFGKNSDIQYHWLVLCIGMKKQGLRNESMKPSMFGHVLIISRHCSLILPARVKLLPGF